MVRYTKSQLEDKKSQLLETKLHFSDKMSYREIYICNYKKQSHFVRCNEAITRNNVTAVRYWHVRLSTCNCKKQSLLGDKKSDCEM